MCNGPSLRRIRRVSDAKLVIRTAPAIETSAVRQLLSIPGLELIANGMILHLVSNTD